MPDAKAGFSLRTAAFVVVSSTVGSGILGTVGYVVVDAGGHIGAILVWTLGGLAAACGALTLAEISASLPKSGGEFIILSEAYGPLVGFVGGWVSLLFGFIAPIAASASASAAYLLAPIGFTGVVETRLAGTCAILGFALAHSLGRSGTERVQGITTLSTISVLLAFIIAGLWAGRGGLPSLVSHSQGLAWTGLFVGVIRVSYAYTGWNGASYVAGEIADAQRVLPRAILLGTLIVFALYLGIVVVLGLALPYSELASLHANDRESLERIVEIAAIRLFGPRGATFVAIAMGIVLLASVSAMVLTGPRVAFAMARDNRLPEFLGRVTSRTESPVAATTAVTLGAIAMLWSGSFEAITFAAGVGLSLNSLFTVAAVYVLRKKRPEWARPFRTPGYPWVPSVFLVLTAVAVLVSFFDVQQSTASTFGLVGVLCGIPAYWIATWRNRRA